MGFLDEYRTPPEQQFPFEMPDRTHLVRDTSHWDQNPKPKVLKVKGVDTTLYGVGNLAKALNRSPLTIRHWERDKIIPNALFIKRSKESVHGNRRLYTREQIIGLVEIAEEEGLMQGDYRSVTKTKFTERAYKLFRETMP